MHTAFGHLTYCTNIHPGENWADHFSAIKAAFPLVKQALSPNAPMGIGLRLSNIASIDLSDADTLNVFKRWLKENDAYVFTMNGFPYGGFHNTRVKDQVHAPDWTTDERVEYTKRLFQILQELMPDGIDAGISTSPLSYRHWAADENDRSDMTMVATMHIIEVVLNLIGLHQTTGKWLHLDIEPEPDGLLETGQEFIDWYDNILLPMGSGVISAHLGVDQATAVDMIKSHVQLCYDICHFAIGYENHSKVLHQLDDRNIRVGKIQVSAALKGLLPEHPAEVINAFQRFDEPTYLHQVVARKQTSVSRYRDLPDALGDGDAAASDEWRAHFHVPIFIEDLSPLKSTQSDIKTLLHLQRNAPFTTHIEVETYTWEVLPSALKLPLNESIIRELQWVLTLLQS